MSDHLPTQEEKLSPQEEKLSELTIDLLRKLNELGIQMPVSSYSKLSNVLRHYLKRAMDESQTV